MAHPPIHIETIPTETTHEGTTQVKRLIPPHGQHPGNVATMNYAWLEPGKQLTQHVHTDGEEFYFFLEGKGQILVGNDWFDVTAGDFVTVPPSHAHSVKNTDSESLVFLTVRTQV